MFSVEAFGAVGDGMTDDTAAINAAIAACEAAGGGVVYFPAGPYRCNGSVNLTNRTSGITIRGENWQGAVIASHAAGKAAVDVCGSRYLKFNNMCIWGDAVDTPACGILGARIVGHPNCNISLYRDMSIGGKFQVAAWYLLDCESITLSFARTVQLDAPYGYYCSATNDYGIQSDFQEIDTDYVDGSTQHHLRSCNFGFLGGADRTPIRMGKNCNNWQIRDSQLTAYGAGVGIEVAEDVRNLCIDCVVMEGTAGTFLKVAAGTTINGLRVVQSAQYITRLIEAGADSTIYGLIVDLCRTANLELYDVYYGVVRYWWTNQNSTLQLHNFLGGELWVCNTNQLHVTGKIDRSRLYETEVSTRAARSYERPSGRGPVSEHNPLPIRR